MLNSDLIGQAGKTAVEVAAQNQHQEVVEYLRGVIALRTLLKKVLAFLYAIVVF